MDQEQQFELYNEIELSVLTYCQHQLICPYRPILIWFRFLYGCINEERSLLLGVVLSKVPSSLTSDNGAGLCDNNYQDVFVLFWVMNIYNTVVRVAAVVVATQEENIEFENKIKNKKGHD